jgi:hypothetical protein
MVLSDLLCSRRLSSVLSALFLISLPPTILLTTPLTSAAQTAEQPASQPAASQTKPASAPAKPVTKSKADKADAAAAKAKIEQQKALALSLLVSLSNEARSFSDQKLRARTLSKIADALWEVDPEQGRALFRKAWDAAEVADQESVRRAQEDRDRQPAGTRSAPFVLSGAPDLRAEVLRFAARRDRALGEELLDKLTEAREREATDATSRARNDDPDSAFRQRLRLANELLETDVERAMQFADPALATVTMDGLSFLSFLREKNAAAADQRYARLLAVAEADLKTDANIVSLLSSYIFSPHSFVIFEADGGQNSSHMGQPTPPPQVAPELRNAYFRMAALILLRPSPSREQDQSSSGTQGKFLVIRRLLPLFEQYATKEITDQLRSEMAVLGQNVAEDVRDLDEDNPIQPMNTPERKAEDVEKSLLDRIDRAKTSEERDALYLQLASRAARKGDLRARDFADKIEDSELRKKAKPYIDMNLAMEVVEKKQTEKALLIAAKGELLRVQKVWLLTEAAKSLPPADRERALEIVGEAAVEARRIEGGDPDRTRALVAVANAYLGLDRVRAWEMMLEVAKASNSAAGFNGEDGRLTIRLESKNMMSMQTSSVDEFNLPGVFRTLSQENATQAIEIARSFEHEAPRATALIAVARALLSEKSK